MPVRVLVLIVVGVLLAGCGASGTGSTPTPTPTRSVPSPTPGSEPTQTRIPPTPTVVVGKVYARFVTTLCHDFATRNAAGVINVLPYYQYNNGLRWGMMGDGEGTTSDPSLMRTWLAGSNVRCRWFSPGHGGHGTVLATGWKQPATSALIELDLYPGSGWKINDFTFGREAVLYDTMQTAGPRLRFRG